MEYTSSFLSSPFFLYSFLLLIALWLLFSFLFIRLPNTMEYNAFLPFLSFCIILPFSLFLPFFLLLFLYSCLPYFLLHLTIKHHGNP